MPSSIAYSLLASVQALPSFGETEVQRESRRVVGEPAAQVQVDVYLREVATQSDSANITTIYWHHTTALLARHATSSTIFGVWRWLGILT